MSIRKLGETDVITTVKSTPIHEVAKLMKKNNIGNVVVVSSEADNKPIGILTDRDITVKIIANELDAKTICAGDVMSSDLLVLKDNQGMQEALEMMCAKGVRRAPIINDNSKIVGIASIDDLLILIADELSSLAKLVRKQIAG